MVSYSKYSKLNLEMTKVQLFTIVFDNKKKLVTRIIMYLIES